MKQVMGDVRVDCKTSCLQLHGTESLWRREVTFFIKGVCLGFLISDSARTINEGLMGS
jgi:hypothetical protein